MFPQSSYFVSCQANHLKRSHFKTIYFSYTLLILSCLITLINSSNTTANSNRCFKLKYQPDYGCTNFNSSNLIIEYEKIGIIECGGAYSISQTKSIPTVKLTIADPTKFYTILLVDTSKTRYVTSKL